MNTNNYPIVTFASDTNIAKLQAGFAEQALSAKVETHKVDSSERIELKGQELEGKRDKYIFISVITFVLCVFQFMQSDAFLEITRDYYNNVDYDLSQIYHN